jgi:putative copper resistance protein D
VSAPSLPSLLISHWQASWSVDVGAAACAAVYLCATGRLRTRWPLRRTASFLAGIACVLVALQSGIDTFDDQLLSVHMVQHMLLLMLAPLLLLGGRPVILALRALPARRRPGMSRALDRLRPVTGPASCVVTFSVVLVLTHLPAFYDATLRHPALHQIEHALYLVSGLLLWWPMLDGDPVPARRLGGLGRLVYMLAAMPAMALVGAYLNRHATLVYPAYGAPARALAISGVVDQQQAGAIMWVAGSVIMVAVGLWSAVAALVAEERRQQAREARGSEREASSLSERRAGTIEGSLQ